MHDIQIFIVDDDASVRDSLALLLGLKGYYSASFECAEHFLASLRPDWRGCVVTDVDMPGMSGLELQATLARMGGALPVVVMSASCDLQWRRAPLPPARRGSSLNPSMRINSLPSSPTH